MPGAPRKRAVLLLVLLTMAPDIDVLLHLVSDTFYLQHHRGITHSLLMLPLWCWLIATLLRRQRYSIPAWWIGAALLLHILLDTITSFGTMILAPFSDWRATLDLVFIIDPLFTACLLLPLLLSLLWQRFARLLACTALLLMGSYLGMTVLLHEKALEIVHQMQPEARNVAALPLPFSPFHWQLIARYPKYYRRSSVDLWPDFDGTSPLFSPSFTARYGGDTPDIHHMQWQTLPAMDAMKLPEHTPGLAFYRWFARFPVLLSNDGQQLEFGDLRFGAGAPGVTSAFRLHVITGPQARAWLIWRGERSNELH